MFKLNRMDHLVHAGEPVEERAVPMPEFETTQFFPANVRLKALFDPSMKWHLIESYGVSSYQIQTDGPYFSRGKWMKRVSFPGCCPAGIK